jgi:hypothetical protein
MGESRPPLSNGFVKGKRMRISFKFLACAAFGALIVAFAAPARAGLLNFSFSFTTVPHQDGTTPGTVTGEIEGLSDNSTGAASDVIIETAPSALGGISTEGPLPIDLNASGWVSIFNSFTVSGGQITDASFFAVAADSNAGIFLNVSGDNLVTFDDEVTTVANEGGFAGATYAPLVAAPSVPEPASFQVGFASLPILGFWFWKRRRTAAV